jgi:uncharacterized protein YdeI (YjbR/CyaY-like superfamily)
MPSAHPHQPSRRDPRVDAYIAKAKPFAQPILTHLRESFHRAAPEVEEAIKWSMPFFVMNGVILGNMAGFKEHCSLGLWGGAMSENLKAAGIDSNAGMGKFGRIAGLKDLPPKKQLDDLIREAARLIVDGERTQSIERPTQKKAARAVVVPDELAMALKKNKSAAMHFEAMTATCRREYAEWIGEAKQKATRDRRVTQAVEWIAEGKKRNWKYQNC